MIVQAPDGTEIEFPDDTPEDVMAEAMRKYVAEAAVNRGVERAQAGAMDPSRGRLKRNNRALLEENLVQTDPRLSGAAHINDAAAGSALPAAVAGATLPYWGPIALRAAASPITSAAIGGYQGYKRHGLMGAVEGAALGAATNKFLGIGGGKLIDWAMRLKALRALGGGAAAAAPVVAKTAPAAVEAVAPAAVESAPAIAETVAAAPAVLSKAEAVAKLEALIGKNLYEGRVAAAAKEAAKGNRQLAEKLLKTVGSESAPASFVGQVRNFRAGMNSGSIRFASAEQRDLFDLGSKLSRSVRGAGERGVSLDPVDRSALSGVSAEMRQKALAVYRDVLRQMKGLKQDETRALADSLLQGEGVVAP